MVSPVTTPEDLQDQYEHRYDERQEWIYASVATALFFATLTVILQLMARRKQGLRLGWNDYTITVALLLTSLVCGAILKATSLGLGLHAVVVGIVNGTQVAKWLFIAEVISPFAGVVARISVLLLYQRIFGTRSRVFNVCLCIVGAGWISFAITGFLATMLQCLPIRLAWTTNHSEKCLNLEKTSLSLTLYSIFLNLATLMLPTPMIWRLNLTLRRNLAIAALFVTAGGVIVIIIIRAATTYEINPNRSDITWGRSTYAVLGVLELTLGIICACIPTLRPLFVRFANNMSLEVEKAGLEDGAWTVPFVMLRSTTTSTGGKAKLRRTSQFEVNLDEEKLLGTSLSTNPNLSPSKSIEKGTSRFSVLKPCIFRKSGTFAKWPAHRQREQMSQKEWETTTTESAWPRGSTIEPIIAQSLIQSGYQKAFHPPASPQFQRKFLDEDPYPTSTPANSRKSSKHRTTMRGLKLDTKDEIIRPPSCGRKSRDSPFTGASSATLRGDLKSPIAPIKPLSPLTDVDTSFSRSSSRSSKPRRPSGPVLPPTRYEPPPPPTTNRAPPRNKSNGKRKGPHYVKSPLTDPDEKIRIGSPREIHIKTPTRGRSLKDTLKTPSLKTQRSNPDLRHEPKVPTLEPHYQRELAIPTAATSPVHESALPSPLDVSGFLDKRSELKDQFERFIHRKTDDAIYGGSPQASKQQHARAGSGNREKSRPRGQKRPERERWYVDASKKRNVPEPSKEGKTGEKPLPPLPPKNRHEEPWI